MQIWQKISNRKRLPLQSYQSFCRLSTVGLMAVVLLAGAAQSALAQHSGDGKGGKKSGSKGADESPKWTKIIHEAFDANISGNTDEAYSKYRAAYAAAEKEQDVKGMIACLQALADFLDSRGILPDQESPRKRALELSEKKYGKESPEYAVQLARMGSWYAKTGSIGPAKTSIEQASAILGKDADSKLPLEKAHVYLAEARLQIAEGSLSLADESFKKALALQESKTPTAQAAVLKTSKEYANLLDKLGKKAEADKMRERVNKAKGPESTRTASGSTPGSFLDAVQAGKEADKAKDRVKARAAWQKAVDEAEKRPDLDNQLPFALVRLGDEFREDNKIGEAVTMYKRALALREKSGTEKGLGLARNLERLALCYNAMAKWSESESLLKRALDTEHKVQASDQIIATTMESLLPACMANKDFKEAEQIAKQLLALSAKQSGPAAANNKRMATGVLGSIYIHNGKVDEGMKLMKELGTTPANANAYQARKNEIETTTDQSEMKK